MWDQAPRAIVRAKIEGYFLPRPGEPEEQAFNRAKAECLQHFHRFRDVTEGFAFAQFREPILTDRETSDLAMRVLDQLEIPGRTIEAANGWTRHRARYWTGVLFVTEDACADLQSSRWTLHVFIDADGRIEKFEVRDQDEQIVQPKQQLLQIAQFPCLPRFGILVGEDELADTDCSAPSAEESLWAAGIKYPGCPVIGFSDPRHYSNANRRRA